MEPVPEEVKAATQTSLTGVFDAVSPHATELRLFNNQLLNGSQTMTLYTNQQVRLNVTVQRTV